MIERKTNLFTAVKAGEAICITTNGIVKANGDAVMGAGIAKTARDTYPTIASRLGQKLKTSGNHVHHLETIPTDGGSYFVLSFPTKHHWRDPSDIALIQQSCKELVAFCNTHGITTCYVPQPGCTNGRLDWESQVRPAIAPLLDDRFIITTL